MAPALGGAPPAGSGPRRELRVVEDLAAGAAAEIEAIGPRTLALAGGSTPREVYRRLATARVDWRSLDVFFGDERCVPADHPDSNFRMAHEALLAGVPVRVHRMPGETCAASAYEAELRAAFETHDRTPEGVPVFDLVLLGLGEDGHTASLFPGDPALLERERLVVRVERPDHPRLTLTLPVLSAARAALFLVAGAAKREPLRRLLAGDPALPASHVGAARVVIFADREAAAGG
jgi:6-phosphogluconolactonase